MKVLVLHSELGVLRGGGENFTRSLFSAFCSRGHNIAAAFVADGSGKYPIPLPAGIRPIPIKGWWSRNFGQATLSNIGRRIPVKSRLRSHWDRIQRGVSWRTIRWHNRRFQHCVEREFSGRWSDFDVVYVHGDPNLAARVSAYRPTVVRLPGPFTAEYDSALRAVHVVCANGDALIRIREFLGDHASELPTGIDIQLFKPGPTAVRSALKWTEQDVVVGYVGQLTRLKGVDLFVSAYRKILAVMGNTRCLIVGSGPEESNIRKTLLEELDHGLVHMERDVSHETLSDWYRAMDLLVMPSRYENFSNAMLEGSACGVPFLASNIGGNRMMAEVGSGWLFEPESVSSLSCWLSKILKNKDEMKSRGEVGYRHVQKYHTWDQTAACLESIMSSKLKLAI